MSFWDGVALVLAAVVALYLIWALLRAEDFQ